jgi:Asp/Glu/hydantoin racemase
MSSKLALLHTSHVLIPAFDQLCEENLPDTSVFHIVDKTLIEEARAAGAVTESIARRMASYVQSAHKAGADVVMITCSSIGPGVKIVRYSCDFPVLRVDEPMAAEAVRIGGRIGVAATLSSTLEPTLALLRETAEAHSRKVEVVTCVCEGAFPAFLAGDIETHDRIVMESLKDLMQRTDVIVLAQASMATVVRKIPRDGRRVPILSSPVLAIQQAKRVLYNSH